MQIKTILLGILIAGSVHADDLEALRALMGDLSVRIEHSETLIEAKDGKPQRRNESWRFMAGGLKPSVSYSRYLNQPPKFAGSFPSLANSDMGIGLNGGPFRNWYTGNAIRVLLDGKDIFAERPAQRIETQEAESGHLRLIWELEKERRVLLHLTVPGDGTAVFVRLDLEPGHLPFERVDLHLTCYPGGFGPAHRLPSHRWVMTEKHEAEVPRDFVRTDTDEFPRLPISTSDAWVFYADKLQSQGSLGLLLLPEENATGQIRMSNYGQSTRLSYPESSKRIHLALYAFEYNNDMARRTFMRIIDSEQQALRSISFWQ